MSFYEDKVLPLLIDKACSSPPVMAMRRKVVPHAKGQVLEVGMGSGINLALYDAEKIDFVWGLEPSVGMRHKARGNLEASEVEVKWLDLPGEQIPLEDECVDTVLLTFTLCTIPDWKAALEQMRRVLKPDGQLLFCEHGLSPDAGVQRWQNRVTPVWKQFAGGCHLNRPIADYLQEAGFEIQELNNTYADKTPRIAGYIYYGCAKKKN